MMLLISCNHCVSCATSYGVCGAARARRTTSCGGRREVQVRAGPARAGTTPTGALAAAHLRRGGVTEVVVLNRSRERARRLADNVRGTGTRPAPPRYRTSWPWRTCW